jgi:polyisoprenoid-binding protein YceI
MSTAHGTLHVFTFKEGILARAAHDLRLTLERFQVSLEQDMLTAVFETASLRVDGTMRDGRLDRSELAERDRLEIEGVIRSRILAVDTYPRARLEAQVRREGAVCSIDGELELLGQRRKIAFEARPTGTSADEWEAEVALAPSRWGVRPYSAMLGAIRLADRIRVVARLQIRE